MARSGGGSDADVLELLQNFSPARLEHTAVDVRALDDTAIVTLKQWYKSGEDAPTSLFFFSLPPGAAVHALEVTVIPTGGVGGARRVAARVMEKQQARAAFKSASRAGRGAYELESLGCVCVAHSHALKAHPRSASSPSPSPSLRPVQRLGGGLPPRDRQLAGPRYGPRIALLRDAPSSVRGAGIAGP